MLSKEKVKACLLGENTSIIPCYYFWMDEKFVKKNQRDVQEMRNYFQDDFISPDLRFYKKIDTPSSLAKGEFIDEWGCFFVSSLYGAGAHPTRPIITTVEQWEEYREQKMPKFDQEHLAMIRKTALANPGCYVTVKVWRTFYERMCMLIGMERLWEEIALEGDLFHMILEDLRDFTIQCICLVGELGVDGVYLADDWGCQDRLQISPFAWRKHFKHAYAAMIETAHDLGLDVWLHSCGNVTELVPEWIDIGLDVIGNLQPSAMELRSIAQDYRGQITFAGGLDVQFNLIRCDHESIRNEVRNLMDVFRAKKGRFICGPSNSIMPETPVANVWSLFKAMDEFKSTK